MNSKFKIKKWAENLKKRNKQVGHTKKPNIPIVDKKQRRSPITEDPYNPKKGTKRKQKKPSEEPSRLYWLLSGERGREK